MAELAVGGNPSTFTCVGLGSCIGIVLYDRVGKIGGMAHVMLPNSQMVKDSSNRAKFADTAIDEMIAEMVELGALRRNITARIFGGADMFPGFKSKTLMTVGARNAEAVKEELRKRNIKLISKDVGGTVGRTIVFDTATGKVTVKTVSGDRAIDEGRRTKDEGRGTRDEGRRTKDEGRGTRDEGRGTKDEGRGTRDE